jgi:hypothetical protein
LPGLVPGFFLSCRRLAEPRQLEARSEKARAQPIGISVAPKNGRPSTGEGERMAVRIDKAMRRLLFLAVPFAACPLIVRVAGTA